jgi:hypothetical protein
MADGHLADGRRQSHGACAALDQALEDLDRRRPLRVIAALQVVDQPGEFGDIPHVDRVVRDRLVAAEADGNAAIRSILETASRRCPSVDC